MLSFINKPWLTRKSVTCSYVQNAHIFGTCKGEKKLQLKELLTWGEALHTGDSITLILTLWGIMLSLFWRIGYRGSEMVILQGLLATIQSQFCWSPELPLFGWPPFASIVQSGFIQGLRKSAFLHWLYNPTPPPPANSYKIPRIFIKCTGFHLKKAH